MADGYAIRVQRNPSPAAIPPYWETGFFFNQDRHVRQQRDGPFYVVTALNERTQRAEARCAFYVRPDGADSPSAAPFGSVEFAETLPDSLLDELLTTLIDAVRETGAPMLRLVNYPHCYAPDQAERLTANLLERGFRIIQNDANFFLPVDTAPFEANLHGSERRRLRKCREAGFRFTYHPSPDIETVVRFLQETRQRQGYALALPSERLANLLTQFPNEFPVFSVMDGSTTAALTIAVRVRSDILYNFLPASSPDYQRFSPIVLLTDGLFTYCQEQAIRLLDLGVALDADRQPKPGLVRFKQNLGAQSSPKLVFEKAL